MDVHPVHAPFGDRPAGALRIAGIYLVIGGLWILFSDQLAAALANSSATLTTLSTLKGWGYIVVTGLLLYWLIRRDTAALAEGETRYRSLVDLSPDGIVVLRNGQVQFVNPAAAALFGADSPDALVDKSIQSVVNPPDWPSTKEAIERAMRGEIRPDPMQAECVKSNGTAFPVEVTASPLTFAGGRALLVLIRDVTERRRADEALRQSEERFAKAFRSNATALVITTLSDGRVIDANESFCRMIELPRSELVGHTSVELDVLEPAGRQEIMSKLRELGSVHDWENTIRSKSGEVRHVLASLERIVLDGQDCVLSVLFDITERKRRERELEAISRVNAALRAANTRDEVLPIILDQLVPLLAAEAAAFSMRDPVTDESVVEIARGAWAAALPRRLPFGQGISGRTITTGQPYRNNQAQTDPSVANMETLENLPAVACVPLVAPTQVIGALWIARRQPIGDDDLRILTAIADIAANAIHRTVLHERTEKQLQRLDTLHAIEAASASILDAKLILNVMVEQVTTRLQVDAADILIYDRHMLTLEYAAGRGFRAPAAANTRVRLGEGHAGRAALDRRIVAVAGSVDGGPVLSERFPAESFVTYFGVPLIVKAQVKGVLELYHRSPLSTDGEWLGFLETLGREAAIALDNVELFHNLQRTTTELELAYDATIAGWSHAMDLRDREAEGHTRRVTEASERLARALGLGEDEIVHIRRGALLHDVGKMGVPDHILFKPGPLADDEWQILRRHPEYACDMLSPIAYLAPALPIPCSHHEKWDGTGYPRGLKGEQIPMAARLFAVVDVFDELTSERPYRKAMSRQEALELVRVDKGKHFDPQVADVFLSEMAGEPPR